MRKNYLVDDKNGIVCKCCNERFDSREQIFEKDYNDIISSEMKREIGRRRSIFEDVYECEKCQNDTLVHFVKSFQESYDVYLEENWTCLSCGHSVDSTMCSDCGDAMPDSNYNYLHIQWYDNCDDFKYLCCKCGKEFKNEENVSYYDIVE